MSRLINVGPITAYGLALKNGFVGTEAQWLESLKDKAHWHGSQAEYDALTSYDPDTVYLILEDEE